MLAAEPAPTAMNKLAALINDLRISVEIGRLQAQLRRLHTVDLAAADAAIGEAAFKGQLLTATHPTEHDQLVDLNQRIQILTTSPLGPVTSGTATRQPAKSGGPALELLVAERKVLLTRLGAELRQTPPSTNVLAHELAAAQAVLQQVADLELRLQVVTTPASSLARRPFMMAGAVALACIAVVLACTTIRAQYVSWKVNRETTERAKQMAFDQERLQQELKVKAEFEAKQRTERAEESARKEEEHERKRREAAAAERASRVNQVAQREAAMAVALEEKQAGRRVEFEKTAAEEFAKVNLTPAITLSSTLKNYASTASVKGENLDKVRELIGQADWLQVVNLISGENVLVSSDLSPGRATSAARRLNSTVMSIHVQTRFTASRTVDKRTGRTLKENALFAVVCAKDVLARPDFKLLNARPHPAGDGYAFEWRPSDGPVVVFTGNPGANVTTVQNMNGLVWKMDAALEQKVKLGELSKGEKLVNLQRYADQLLGNFVKAASVQ